MRVGIDCRKIGDFGIGTYVRGLLTAFSELDTEIDFVLFVPPDKINLVPLSDRFQIVHEDSPNYSVKELFALQRQVEKSKVDLFHAPHYVTPLTRIPMVVTIHDLIHLMFPEATPNLLAPFYARWMIGRSIERSRAVFVPSTTVRDSIAEKYREHREKIVVTANGVDPAFLEAVPDAISRELLMTCGLDDRGYFLYVGNDKPHKNLRLLIDAFLEGSMDFPRLRLALVGSEFSSVPAHEKIVRTGFVNEEELRSLYQHAFAVVVPSTYEGFGLPIVEAMASGTPVISSSGGALPEVAGDAAITFDPTSRALLLKAMRTLSKDEKLWKELVQRGKKRAKSFSWKATAATTLDTYRRVIEHA